MDSLTHALAVSTVFAMIGRPELIPFAALGAVAPDIDVFFQRFSDRNPRLYIFTHGGITHSIAGSLIVSLLLALPAFIAAGLAGYNVAILSAFMAIIIGGLSHILLDYLAFPGIPLLYPVSDKKYTLGIAAGPTPWLLAASLVYGIYLFIGKASIQEPWLYAGFFGLVIVAISTLKCYVALKAGGMSIPGFNPLQWLIVREDMQSYHVYGYHLLKGKQPGVDYRKLDAVSMEEKRALEALPEVRRMRYHSYMVTAARDGNAITLTDPLREHGYIWYPPYYKRLVISDMRR